MCTIYNNYDKYYSYLHIYKQNTLNRLASIEWIGFKKILCYGQIFSCN